MPGGEWWSEFLPYSLLDGAFCAPTGSHDQEEGGRGQEGCQEAPGARDAARRQALVHLAQRSHWRCGGICCCCHHCVQERSTERGIHCRGWLSGGGGSGGSATICHVGRSRWRRRQRPSATLVRRNGDDSSSCGATSAPTGKSGRSTAARRHRRQRQRRQAHIEAGRSAGLPDRGRCAAAGGAAFGCAAQAPPQPLAGSRAGAGPQWQPQWWGLIKP